MLTLYVETCVSNSVGYSQTHREGDALCPS